VRRKIPNAIRRLNSASAEPLGNQAMAVVARIDERKMSAMDTTTLVIVLLVLVLLFGGGGGYYWRRAGGVDRTSAAVCSD
jgi:uncharacterized membrane protein AbrB (regulator of aidB expression)